MVIKKVTKRFFFLNFQEIVIERESQIKEILRVMGLSTFFHWLSWFIRAFSILIIAFTFVSVILCVRIFVDRAFFEKSNFFLVWLFFIFYLTGVTTFCFFVSSVIKKSNSAANVGTMIFFATFVPFNQLSANFPSFAYAVKFLFCLPINTAMGEGIRIVLGQELKSAGIQFSNLFSRGDRNFSFAEILLVMTISSVIHLTMTIYIENVLPWNYGVAKPWNYPVACLLRKKDIQEVFNGDEQNTNDFEAEPRNMVPGIQIKNVFKTFGPLVAVNNLSLNMFEGQITVLLGHNGAGKSTLMHILSGIIPSTTGTAVVNGFNIITESENARKSLGICTQNNVLIDDLTVKEHIIFFCGLKGIKNKMEIDLQISKYLNNLSLKDKSDALIKTLSGGMKRKLNLINALCGNSKTVICDEPSSGIDQNARQDLWDLLIEEKKERTILLSTHHMEEAEVLADRVAVMKEGKLVTVGSTYFLKKKFGSGYRLTCVKKDFFDINRTLGVLREFSVEAAVICEKLSEAVFVLPEKDVEKFPNIFKKLEDNADQLGISSFGCSTTSLEDVFMKIETETNEADDSFNVELNLKPSVKVVGMNLIFYLRIQRKY